MILKLEPSVILDNMDVTEKVMYLDYLTESTETKEEQLEKSLSFEEVLKREGVTLDEVLGW